MPQPVAAPTNNKLWTTIPNALLRATFLRPCIAGLSLPALVVKCVSLDLHDSHHYKKVLSYPTSTYMSTCSIVIIMMSVHIPHQYLSKSRAVEYPRLVIKQRHAFIDCHLYSGRMFQMMNGLGLEASVPFPVIMVLIEPMDGKQVVKSSEPNVDARKESKFPLDQSHLSCLFKWKVKHLGPCSRMIVGSGTADVLYARVLLFILLINLLQPGRGKIICMHRKNVYNNDVSRIINKCIYRVYSKYQACLNSFVNIPIN